MARNTPLISKNKKCRLFNNRYLEYFKGKNNLDIEIQDGDMIIDCLPKLSTLDSACVINNNRMKRYIKRKREENPMNSLHGTFFYVFYELDLEYMFLEKSRSIIPNVNYSRKDKKGALIKFKESNRFIILKVHSAQIILPSALQL